MATEKPRVLAALLQERRAELELTQAQAAESAGTTEREFRRWEKGEVRVPRVSKRAGIARFLGVDLGAVNAVVNEADVDETEERLVNLVRQVLAEQRDI